MASARGDVAMSVYASLTEALVMLKTSKSNPEAIRNCLAQASKHQFDEQAKIPALELLSLLLDVTVGFNQDAHGVVGERLHELKKRMGNPGLSPTGEFLIPVKRSSSGTHTVSGETEAIIRPGNDSESGQDHLVLKFMTAEQMAVVVYVLLATPDITSLLWLTASQIQHERSSVLAQITSRYGTTVAEGTACAQRV